jgi:hypothetical protein
LRIFLGNLQTLPTSDLPVVFKPAVTHTDLQLSAWQGLATFFGIVSGIFVKMQAYGMFKGIRSARDSLSEFLKFPGENCQVIQEGNLLSRKNCHLFSIPLNRLSARLNLTKIITL